MNRPIFHHAPLSRPIIPRLSHPRTRTRPFSSAIPGTPWPLPNIVVGSVMALCGGVYVYKEDAKLKLQKNKDIKPLQGFVNNFVGSRDNITNGRWWTLITSSFAHANFLHLSFNMMSLWGFGKSIVMYYGAPQFAIIWLGGTLAGGLTSLYLQEKTKERVGWVGASSSICAIMVSESSRELLV